LTAPDATDRVQNQARARLWGPLARAIGIDACALVPIGLFGALSVVVLRDVGASGSVSGLVVGSFFLCGALVVNLLGPAVDRLGWRRAALVSVPVTTAACGSAAAVIERWWLLIPCLGAAGAASSILQTASSAYLSSTVPIPRRGFALSAKFAGVPAALLVSGVAVPLAATHVGWRMTFAVTAGLVLLGGALLACRMGPTDRASHRSFEGPARQVRRALWRSGLAMFLGSMLSGVLLGFTTPALVRSGWSTAAAGATFAMFSVLAIVARICVAATADREGHDAARTIAMMLAVGGAGASLVSTGTGPGVIVGAALAFSFGWGWTGESFHMAVRAHPDNPATATSVIQSGGMFGSAAGPLLGAPIEHGIGHAAVWLLAGTASVAAAVMSAWGRSPRSRRSLDAP
jgi:MFS family permease